MNRRVVITGLGVISSIGIGREQFWNFLIAGKSGISPIESFDTSKFATHLGGEVKNFQPQQFIKKQKADNMGRVSQLAVSAARLAFEDSGLKLADYDPERIGVCMGTTMGESGVLEELTHSWLAKGPQAVDAAWIPRYPCNVLASHVAMEFGLQGPHYSIPTACAAGNYAIGFAYDLIQNGDADTMCAGGADGFSRIAFVGFNRLFAVAPEKCQPFDKNRKGMMVGEGAGVVVLESLELALKRSTPIYAEVLGYGLSCDAHHMTAPEHSGIAQAMVKALKESGVTTAQVSYINAHGTGTPANDREECLAVKKTFAEDASRIPMSSIKSMLGHTMGAASAIEAITCCLTVKNDIIPPTINYETPDPECDIDCVPNIARRQSVDVALNSSSAFGGNNACLVLRKFKP